MVLAMNGYTASKDDLLKRLRRVEGQVRGIARMVEEDKYCIDILTQVSAATKALESVALSLLGDHLSHCVAEASAEGGAVADEKIREANEAIARLVRMVDLAGGTATWVILSDSDRDAQLALSTVRNSCSTRRERAWPSFVQSPAPRRG